MDTFHGGVWKDCVDGCAAVHDKRDRGSERGIDFFRQPEARGYEISRVLQTSQPNNHAYSNTHYASQVRHMSCLHKKLRTDTESGDKLTMTIRSVYSSRQTFCLLRCFFFFFVSQSAAVEVRQQNSSQASHHHRNQMGKYLLQAELYGTHRS
jgi:hypothetical protein